MKKIMHGARRRESRWRDGRIEIEPAPAPVRLQRRGRLLVAVPKRKLPPLAPEAVEQTRSRLLDERSAEE